MNKHKYKSQFTTNFELCKGFSKTSLTIFYIHGLYSNPYGRKPEEVKAFCQKEGLNFFRFELIGHGEDKENYEKADINVWKDQVLEAIDNLVEGDLILIGSSLGGWLSLLAAIARPKRVKGIIGMSAAADFTADISEYLLTPELKKELEEKGRIEIMCGDHPYVFTQKLIDSGTENLLLNNKIKITCPVHLIQGQQDQSQDWRKALKIAAQLESEQVTVKLLKNSTHRLGDDEAIEEILNSLNSIIKTASSRAPASSSRALTSSS